MRVPLNIGHVPRPALWQESRNLEREFKIDDEQPSATMDFEYKGVDMKEVAAYAAKTTSRLEGLMLIYNTYWVTGSAKSKDLVLTLPTASPTRPLLSICMLRLKVPPSSGEDGSESRLTVSRVLCKVCIAEGTSRNDMEGANVGLLADKRLWGSTLAVKRSFCVSAVPCRGLFEREGERDMKD